MEKLLACLIYSQLPRFSLSSVITGTPKAEETKIILRNKDKILDEPPLTLYNKFGCEGSLMLVFWSFVYLEILVRGFLHDCPFYKIINIVSTAKA